MRHEKQMNAGVGEVRQYDMMMGMREWMMDEEEQDITTNYTR